MYQIIKERFLDYTNSIIFNQEQADILHALKVTHTNRVDNISEILAKSVFQNDNKSSEYVALAKVIGVLHDIGRWDQMKTHKGFSDNLHKTDHGEIGAKILIQNNILKGVESEYQRIILLSVREHNKKNIENYDEFTQIFLNIIRDADRIDNLYIEVENYNNNNNDNSLKNILPYSDEHKLSLPIFNNAMSGTLADVKDLKTKIDFKFFKMIWCFDMKFVKSMEIIRKNKYIEAIYSDISSPDEMMHTAYEKIIQHLNQ